MRNDFMILYCHKKLHHRWSVGPRSAFDIFFLWETLLKRLKFNQVNIFILKVKKKSTKTRYEFCPKLPIKAPKRLKFCRSGVFIANFVLCTFSILTLKSWMPVGTCCIHFHIYRSSHPEVFFKKGVIRIVRQFTEKHPCKRSTFLRKYERTCSRMSFLVKASEELLLYNALNREIINVEVVSKKIKTSLKYILIFLTFCETFAWWPKVSFRSHSGCW